MFGVVVRDGLYYLLPLSSIAQGERLIVVGATEAETMKKLQDVISINEEKSRG